MHHPMILYFISFQADGNFHFSKKKSVDGWKVYVDTISQAIMIIRTAWNRSSGWRSRRRGPHGPSDFDRSTAIWEGGGQIMPPHFYETSQMFRPSNGIAFEACKMQSRVWSEAVSSFPRQPSFHTCTGELGVSNFLIFIFDLHFILRTCYVEDFSKKVRKYLILGFISTR